MAQPPRIWLDYRPVRIGWVVANGDSSQLATAARWSSCLWGGLYNPVIPIGDREQSCRMIGAFHVDVLIPIVDSPEAAAFISDYPQLDLRLWGQGIFKQKKSEFADIRHPLRRASVDRDQSKSPSVVLPTWESDDPLSPFFAVAFGAYPIPDANFPDYLAGLKSALKIRDIAIPRDGEIPAEIVRTLVPVVLTAVDLTPRGRSGGGGWLAPAVVLGTATDFDDLVLMWNLRAAGAEACFYDGTARSRVMANEFLSQFRAKDSAKRDRVNFWSRRQGWPETGWPVDLDTTGIQPSLCRAPDCTSWNGLNIVPLRPFFSRRHRDVVPAFSETPGRASASFALPNLPFDDEDRDTINQLYVVTVDAKQYGKGSDDNLTFQTPYAPSLNEFYGRNFYFDHDKARADPGSLGQGAVGIITRVGTQRIEVSAIAVSKWIGELFSSFGISAERSEPGRRSGRLIRQLGGVQGCRVLKIRGVRELVRKYGPDESFTRTGAVECIRDVDQASGTVGFDAFKGLHIGYRERGDLKPDDVLKYLVSRRVFRVGLDFKCPSCELVGWIHLDEVKTTSRCVYCGHDFDVTPQLRDRDWKYRRSGLFGRDDDQLGAIPAALAIQQLDTSLHDAMLMYSTAIEFKPVTANIERCEADFVAIIAGAQGIQESPVQIVFGEAKTHKAFDVDDVRKLGKLADAVPSGVAQAFIMFAKTDRFTDDEIALARMLNTEYVRRVILWSQEELEPYFAYERSADRLGPEQYAVSLSDMANVTDGLWLNPEGPQNAEVLAATAGL